MSETGPGCSSVDLELEVAMKEETTNRIAVVDDVPAVRTGLTRLLRSAGYEASAYPSADEFLGSLGASPPACVILDLRMPGKNGFEVLSRLAALDSDIPVIVLTSYPSPEVRRRALEAGVSVFLEKPVDRAVLLSAIEQALTPDSPSSPIIAEG
jgi:FixJ family two-component response regulator